MNGTLRYVDAGVLSVGYVEAGPLDGSPVLLLHGWPYDVHSFVEVIPILTAANRRVIVPYVRGYGPTRFLANDTVRNGQPSALAVDVIDLLDALNIDKATVAGFDWGARTANIIGALWPERCRAMVPVSGYLISSQQAGQAPLPPNAELQWWYQYYFATERGRAGYERYRREFARLIWRTASPHWMFDDATYDRSAEALDNPDHVSIVVHNYRWRLGLVEGEPRYDALERRLATGPDIPVPTITLEGDANGAPHPEAEAYAKKFTGSYEHRVITGGIGHNLPQEAPGAFAEAVLEVDRGTSHLIHERQIMTAKSRQSRPPSAESTRVRERYQHLFLGDGGNSQPMLHRLGTEIQEFRQMRLLPIALSEETRIQSCEELNRILADTQIIYSLYKKHHWLMRGLTFYQLHLLLDKHAAEQLELVDLLAERVQTLGGVAVGDPRHVAEITTVPRPPDGAEEVLAMLSRLLEAHEIILAKVRDAIENTARTGDAGTNDILTSEVLRTNEFQVWFIAEHLVDQP